MSSYGGANATMGDVVRTVLVLAGAVLGLFLLGRLFFTVEPEHPVKEVDYHAAAEGVEPAAGFVPLAPASLPEGWRATSARFDAGSWQLGVVTDDEQFVGWRQVRDSDQEAYDDAVGDSAETVTIAGRQWQVSEHRKERTYAHSDGGLTYVVRSTTDERATENYIASFESLVPSADASR